MGVLVEGEWKIEGFDTRTDSKGYFQRAPSQFRNWISRNPGSRFPPEASRYHLYVSFACPWAHRTMIVRALKGLENTIGISIVDPVIRDQGWEFSEGPGCIPDTVNRAKYLREIYVLANPMVSGPVTVPVLWDKQNRTIVNNESSEIIRMFNAEFRAFARETEAGLEKFDFYPSGLRQDIDRINERIYERVNNGVYMCGFARSQDAYERAFEKLFAELDELERLLASQPFLAGHRFTEADVRLFTTLYRFDPVYNLHFKCNRKRIRDYPHLWSYVRMIYQIPGVRTTCDLAHIKSHYYRSHPSINPTGIVPLGPDIDFDEPSDRPSPLDTIPNSLRQPAWSETAPHIDHGV